MVVKTADADMKPKSLVEQEKKTCLETSSRIMQAPLGKKEEIIEMVRRKRMCVIIISQEKYMMYSWGFFFCSSFGDVSSILCSQNVETFQFITCSLSFVP